MRKEYRRALRRAFEEQIASGSLPFERVRKLTTPIVPGGDLVFRWNVCPTLTTFLLVGPDENRQAFTVELGWSKSGEFPDVTMRPNIILGPSDPDPLDVEEGIVRLGNLKERKDRWWELSDPPLQNPGDLRALQWSIEPLDPDEARTEVEPAVESAMSEVRAVALPFIDTLKSVRCR